jgi:GT2 family glycosyltransferase
MRVDLRRRSLELTLRLADALRGRAYKLPAPLLLPSRPRAAPPAVRASEAIKAAATALSTVELEAFLSSAAELSIPSSEAPEVSVLLVAFNRAELTFECLQSLCAHGPRSFELVIVDNASTDRTSALLERVRGATILRNQTNTHFLAGANQAAHHARGRYLLFLNNDVRLLPSSVDSALRTLRASSSIGAVGGRLVLLDGTLQEAGSIVWNDGSCLGYGRGDHPADPAYMFTRDVDFCSGAFFLTPRHQFEALGGFDPDFSPAYGEEADYCLRLWERGFRVVYDPDAVALHYEFASSTDAEEPLRLQGRNRETLRRKHAAALRSHLPPAASRALQARRHQDRGRRVLFVDDRVPRATFGSGSPRTREMVSSLLQLGYLVTFYPLTEPFDTWRRVRDALPREVEVMMGYGAARFAEFLAERRGYYDVLLVSRPHNMSFIAELTNAHPEHLAGLEVLYDAEAIYSLREVAGGRLRGEPIPGHRAEALLAEELDIARAAHRVIAVSEGEAREFRSRGLSQVHVLGHALTPRPTPRAFGDRGGFLFVGSVHEDKSPNADSLRWFIREVWPLIEGRIGRAAFDVVGENHAHEIRGLAAAGVTMVGPLEDLIQAYDGHRVFVAPTRFAAGIPLKVQEAAAHGIPVVATPLLAHQLGWRDGVELLAAESAGAFAEACVRLYHDAGLWSTLRENALARLERDCSPVLFRRSLRAILGANGRGEGHP